MREAPKLTRLARVAPDHVALDVDGRPWRVVPDAVVLACGLAEGVDLDRPLLRRLRTELLCARALDTAARMLSRRDLARARLAERLHRAGIPSALERSALATLAEAGLVDDGRLAGARARALADRGWGDAAILARLEDEGLERRDAEAAVGELVPERERAAAIAARAGDRRKAFTVLARRGFSAEAVEDALGGLDDER